MSDDDNNTWIGTATSTNVKNSYLKLNCYKYILNSFGITQFSSMQSKWIQHIFSHHSPIHSESSYSAGIEFKTNSKSILWQLEASLKNI